MKDRPTFEDIVTMWKVERGRIPPNDAQRVAAFLDLFATLELHGYEKADVRLGSNFNLIVRESHNPHAKKGKEWQRNVERTLKDAIMKYWPILTATADPDKLAKTVTYSDVPAPASVEGQPNQESEENDWTGTPAESEPVTRKEYTPEEWAKLPTPEPEYDPELRKLLGFEE